MSEMSDYLQKVRADLDRYRKLKEGAPGTPKGWFRDGYMLRTRTTVKDGVGTDITYFGSYGLQGKADDAALDFCVAAHNIPFEEYLTTLLKMAELAPEAKAKSCIPAKDQAAAVMAAAK